MKFAFKSKGKADESAETFINPHATNYRIYEYSLLEKILYAITGFIAVFVVGYIFYESIIMSCIAGVIGAIAFLPIRRNTIIKKRNDTLQKQFRDFLESLSISIGVGKNMRGALETASEELTLQYSAQSFIVEEVELILTGINDRYDVKDLFNDLAQRTNIEDVQEFADVFNACYSRGIDIKSVINKTVKVINEKSDIKMDITTMITAKKTEQNAISFMPIVFVAIIKTMGGEMIDLSSAVGRIASTISILIFVASFFISKKILDIKL